MVKLRTTLFVSTVLAASVLTCARPDRWMFLPVLPLIYAAYHVGYGYGFMRGIVDFTIRRKGAAVVFSKLTR